MLVSTIDWPMMTYTALLLMYYSATISTGATQGFLTNQKPICQQRISTLWFSKPIKFNPKINLYMYDQGYRRGRYKISLINMLKRPHLFFRLCVQSMKLISHPINVFLDRQKYFSTGKKLLITSVCYGFPY